MQVHLATITHRGKYWDPYNGTVTAIGAVAQSFTWICEEKTHSSRKPQCSLADNLNCERNIRTFEQYIALNIQLALPLELQIELSQEVEHQGRSWRAEEALYYHLFAAFLSRRCQRNIRMSSLCLATSPKAYSSEEESANAF